MESSQTLWNPAADLVVEPFAGGAGYSTYWEPKRVILVERDPLIANLWKYLTRVSAKEILQLPTQIDSLSELPASICQESKWLTCQSRSNWARSQQYRHLFWGPQIQARIASQVDHVRHWQIVEGDYRKAPNVTAHWFIDPPYILAGQHYEHNSDSIDYEALGQWCRNRKGTPIQVCENTGADWLPFRAFGVTRTHRQRGYSAEAVFEQCGA